MQYQILFEDIDIITISYKSTKISKSVSSYSDNIVSRGKCVLRLRSKQGIDVIEGLVTIVVELGPALDTVSFSVLEP